VERSSGHRMKIAALALAVCVLAVTSLLFGSADVSLKDLLRLLSHNDDPGLSTIVLDIRLPRTLLALLVGAGVSASGAAIQGMFRNPLADPALIGVSAGAALFAAIYVVLDGSQGLSLIGMTGSAFVGGLLSTWIVLVVGGRGGGLSTMLLAGIAINAIALSGVGMLSYLSTDMQLRSISFWALGSLNGATWVSVMLALFIPVVVFLIFLESRNLNVITLGDEEAEHLGVSHQKLRVRIVSLCAVAVGIGVALTGVIAFLGLVVPHLVRMTLGSNHRTVVPASALLGGMLLLVADVISRTILAPTELPVGILTALVGGPFFIYLIMIEQKGRLVI
jgi:iron complex transport system permease protein